jgi:hypothetical protein
MIWPVWESPSDSAYSGHALRVNWKLRVPTKHAVKFASGTPGIMTVPPTGVPTSAADVAVPPLAPLVRSRNSITPTGAVAVSFTATGGGGQGFTGQGVIVIAAVAVFDVPLL